jgi:short-subunit dehydrogenase
VHTFMEAIRVDLRGTNVKATCIYPGFVKTEMTAKNRFKMPFLMELDDATRVMARGIAKGAPTIAYPLPTAMGARAISALPSFLYEPLAARAMPQRSMKQLDPK